MSVTRSRPPGSRAASAADTGGRYTLVEITAPAGLQASLPAEASTVPPPSVAPPENIAEIILRHGNELLPD